jgi:hypothetical protein
VHRALSLLVLVSLAAWNPSPAAAAENEPPAGFTALFNGSDLSGWYGMNADPAKVAALPDEDRAKKRAADLEDLRTHWHVENGELVNDGHGVYATTDRDYGDIELYVDYKMLPKGDSGIYLRGTPQVQIWDYTDESKWKLGADKGSGGLWNNSKDAPGKDPLVLADKPLGEWNRFHIIQVGARTTVYLNDTLVVDHAIMENYWDRSRPLYRTGPIQLQTHGSEIRWRNIFVREIPPAEADQRLGRGFVSVFNGKDLQGWEGATDEYEVVDGAIRCQPHKGGVLYTHGQYSDFVAQIEIMLPEGGNNGLAIRYPGHGDPAYSGMCELQVLDTESPKYAKIDARQAHGSVYGMVAAQRGYLRPAGEWNFEQVTIKGSTVKVELNGTVILNADIKDVTDFMGGQAHPGKDLKVGHFGFAGHGDAVSFRNIRILRLN